MPAGLQMRSILHIDSVASFEYFRVFRQKADFAAEEKLMLAVLNDAIECLIRYRGAEIRRHKALYREAREWILSRDGTALYSFESICETLKIDANYLRLGLLQWLTNPPANIRRLKVWRQPVRYRGWNRQVGPKTVPSLAR